ncbi:hypothetical protein HGM15179_006944 [Zosterops borbonicus]|uniref:Reverse transcriptase thumb domain-containing protein n=1 Tax=Zosterops borbonicus TaxID=364589 RepID=A0A8K1GM13_9PASS|nr:hypothetical protein HGM15179_006944 [Zosterops borbonicus]
MEVLTAIAQANANEVCKVQVPAGKDSKDAPLEVSGPGDLQQKIRPQKLVIKDNPRILVDVCQLCGALNWVRPWLGFPTET